MYHNQHYIPLVSFGCEEDVGDAFIIVDAPWEDVDAASVVLATTTAAKQNIKHWHDWEMWHHI